LAQEATMADLCNGVMGATCAFGRVSTMEGVRARSPRVT
jgi:hypothetical protein